MRHEKREGAAPGRARARRMAVPLVRIAAIAAALAIIPRPVAGEPRRRVHVDNVDPAKVPQYEQARRAWLAWIVEHKAVDPWGGLFLQVGKATFLTVRPFTRYADLDPVPASVQIDGQVQARYNEGSDAALVPPHRNEIWLRQPELDYQPARPVSESGGVGRIVFEEARMASRGPDEYFEAWKVVRAELTGANYPVARIAFLSQFGTGRHVSLWIAPTAEAFARTPPIEQVLAGRLGSRAAKALLARWRGAVLEREEHEVVARRDLTNPEYLDAKATSKSPP
jgi:hypothetical protein